MKYSPSVIALSELGERVGLHQAGGSNFFQEWQSDLPASTDENRQRLDRIKAGVLNLLEHPPMPENTVKMVVVNPGNDLDEVLSVLWRLIN